MSSPQFPKKNLESIRWWYSFASRLVLKVKRRGKIWWIFFLNFIKTSNFKRVESPSKPIQISAESKMLLKRVLCNVSVFCCDVIAKHKQHCACVPLIYERNIGRASTEGMLRKLLRLTHAKTNLPIGISPGKIRSINNI